MTTKAISKIYETAKASRNDRGVAYMDGKTIAKLIKAKLAEKFPGVKFSVKSDCNAVSIRWEGLPMAKDVREVTGQYSFGGFDGSIDLAYSCDNWLLPDGTMETADCRGTQGSRGYIPAVHTDCPAPGAILVDSPVKYISESQEIPESAWVSAVRTVLADFGQEWQEGVAWYDQRIDWGCRACEHINRNPEALIEALK